MSVSALPLYFCGKQKKAAAVFYSLFSLMFLLPSMVSAFGGRQWAMVFALPFMLLYNGERGRGLKYFFYLYYPLHIGPAFGRGLLYFVNAALILC